MAPSMKGGHPSVHISVETGTIKINWVSNGGSGAPWKLAPDEPNDSQNNRSEGLTWLKIHTESRRRRRSLEGGWCAGGPQVAHVIGACRVYLGCIWTLAGVFGASSVQRVGAERLYWRSTGAIL